MLFRSGQALPAAGGKLGRTRAGLGALQRSPASAEPQRPLVLLRRLAPAEPSPAFSLSLPLPGSFFSRSSSGRLFLLPEPRRGPDFPLGPTWLLLLLLLLSRFSQGTENLSTTAELVRTRAEPGPGRQPFHASLVQGSLSRGPWAFARPL